MATCLVQGLDEYVGNGNVGEEPGATFANFAGGDFQLLSGSLAIDRGNNVVDADPFTAGIQFLPATDLDGRSRLIDGNGDGSKIVDMGAYEHPY
jgi:hypothetical protein